MYCRVSLENKISEMNLPLFRKFTLGLNRSERKKEKNKQTFDLFSPRVIFGEK